MIVVIDATELDLGKHAYSQMKDFGVDAEVLNVEALDVPREISRRDEEILLILDTDVKFAEQIVGKVLDLEEDRYIEKVFIEKSGGREVFERESRRKTREKAEKLAEKI
jgi:hypothetical protein